DYNEIELVCIRSDGAYEKPNNIQYACNLIRKNIKGLTNFHFHMLRHTYTSNLLAGGANPTDVQELLGHSNISTTLSIYAHSTRDAMRNTAKLMDMVAYGK
ncbi:MAG: tyrosine-type recombinase/integrase, partial [Firmicutes bacterium]|nr:tyrosine-type recombinase/integrase [Bacillota bacterium]